MSYHVWVSVLLNSFVALAIAFILPRMSSHEDPTGRGRMSWWVYFAGLVLISLASRELFFASDSPEQTIHAIWLAVFASLIAPFGGFFASGFKRAFSTI